MAKDIWGNPIKQPNINKILGIGKNKSTTDRKNPSKSLKNLIWDKQHGKCWRCHKVVSPSYAQWHHKNGRRSDTRKGNLALVCANCHGILSNEQRVRGKGKKGKSKGIISFGMPKGKPINW